MNISDTADEFMYELKKLIPNAMENAEEILNDSIYELFNNIKYDTPYHTGKARANWKLNISNQYVWWINNDLEYIQRLEHGYSKQAPSGMVGINLLNMSEYIQKHVKNMWVSI